MALSVIRFDMRAPGMEPREARRLYAAALDMAAWADTTGMDLLVLSEHHASGDGYLPSPLVMAAAVAGRTERIPLNVSALLVPLHDPVRLAEDIAVLDLLSGGRISVIAGLGYRPVEYALLEKVWTRRGRSLDESLEVMLKAWRGEPVERGGQQVVVTPRPLQQPHPMMMIGGSGPKAAERAARFGLGFFPPVADQALVDRYNDACREHGREPGMVFMPSAEQPGTVFVAEDPDRAWDELGPHLLHDATTYASWQPEGQTSAVHSEATTVEAMRAEGVYRVLTPDECVEVAGRVGPMGAITLHPLCGGIPPEVAWPYLETFGEQVLPRLRDST